MSAGNHVLREAIVSEDLTHVGEGDLDDAADVERAWIEEAERRYQDFLAGGIEVIPASEALAQVRAELRGL